MAKKKDKEKGKGSRADAVRSAVDQAFQATAGGAVAVSRERATDIADELSGVVTRLRDTLDEARPATAEDVRSLREELAALAGRVEQLETAQAAPPKPAAKPPRARAATTQAAAKRAQAAARKPAAKGGAATTRTTRSSPAASGASKAASAGSAADGDVRRASTAARTTRARAAASKPKSS